MRLEYTLGVRINGEKISDQAAKIISLQLCGVYYEEAARIIFIKVPSIYPLMSNLYSFLNIKEKMCLLLYYALLSGFDYNFKCNGKELLTPDEKKRLYLEVPRLLQEDTEIIVTLRKRK